MALIIAIDAIVVAILVGVTLTKGFERALPAFAFIVTLVPGESSITLPGLFDLTTHRVATVTLALLYFALRDTNTDAGQRPPTPLKYLVLLLLGWNLISTLNSIVFVTSLKTVLSIVFDFYLVYFIFTKAICDVRTTHRILIAFVAALTVCCVFGLFETYFHWKVVDLFPETGHRFTAGQGGLMLDVGRSRSTFPHAILFANALALGIPWALYLLTKAKRSLEKAYLWVAVMLMFWNMYKTMSRGPWLALALSGAILLFFSPGKLRSYLSVIGVLTLAVLVIRPGVWETLNNTYLATRDPDNPRGSSYEYRYTLMRAGSEALAKDVGRAAWGFGPESFYSLGLEGTNPDTGHTEKYESCDSAFVEIMVDTGYVGLLLVIALLLKPIVVLRREFGRLPRPANSLCLLFFVNLVAFAFMMVSVENWGWGQQSYMLWITLALSMAYPHIARGESLAAQGPAQRELEPAGGAAPVPVA